MSRYLRQATRGQLDLTQNTEQATTYKGNILSLDKAQDLTLHIITGAMKSTMKEHKSLSPGTKVHTGLSYKGKLQGCTKNRLTCSSFVHGAKKLQKQHALILDMSVTTLCQADTINPVEIDISAVTNSLSREERMTIPSELILQT